MEPDSLSDTSALPVLWEVHEIAHFIGWSRRRMLRLLARELRIAFKVGERWVVSTSDLRDGFPQAHRELLRRRQEAAVEGHGGRRRSRRP